MIYFIQSENDKRIKIGHSENPVARLKQLRTGSSTPKPYILLAVQPGGPKKEAEMKSKFKQYLSHNEWFESGEEILEHINGLIHDDGSRILECRVCGNWYIPRPPDKEIIEHSKSHRAIRAGAYPYKIREFMKQIAWAAYDSKDKTTINIASRSYDSNNIKRVIVYAWWARAKQSGIPDKAFDDYILDYMDYLDIKESGDQAGLLQIQALVDKRWGKYG